MRIIVTQMPQTAEDCPFAVPYPFNYDSYKTEEDIIPNCSLKCNETGTDTGQFSYVQNNHTCDHTTCPFLVEINKISST